MQAEEDRVACSRRMCNTAGHIDYTCIRRVIYTVPEVPWVGITEDKATNLLKRYKVRSHIRSFSYKTKRSFNSITEAKL